MSNSKSWRRLLSALPVVAVLFLFVSPAQAQDDDDAVEEITVTGSRIARDEFSTTTPIQVLNTEAAQRIGIVSISELLQKSTAASGQQIDGSISSNAGQTSCRGRVTFSTGHRRQKQTPPGFGRRGQGCCCLEL